jgi:predicted ATPase
MIMWCNSLRSTTYLLWLSRLVQTARQTMLEMQQVLRTLDRELPDTAAAVRLSGLELSDAIEEVSLLR